MTEDALAASPGGRAIRAWTATIDQFERQPVLSSIVLSGSTIAGSLMLGELVDYGVAGWWTTKWFIGGCVLVAASVITQAAVTNVTKTKRQKRETRKAIQKVLAMMAAHFGHPPKHCRTNVMMVSKDGKRRKVDAGTPCNMDSDDDRELEIDNGAGISGRAIRRKESVLWDLTDTPNLDWGLWPAEAKAVRPSLKTILAVPIYIKDEGQKEKLLGTLQLDSDLKKEDLRIAVPDIKFVEACADVYRDPSEVTGMSDKEAPAGNRPCEHRTFAGMHEVLPGVFAKKRESIFLDDDDDDEDDEPVAQEDEVCREAVAVGSRK